MFLISYRADVFISIDKTCICDHTKGYLDNCRNTCNWYMALESNHLLRQNTSNTVTIDRYELRSHFLTITMVKMTRYLPAHLTAESVTAFLTFLLCGPLLLWYFSHILIYLKWAPWLSAESTWATFSSVCLCFPASSVHAALKSPASFHEQRRSLERARVRVAMCFSLFLFVAITQTKTQLQQSA